MEFAGGTVLLNRLTALDPARPFPEKAERPLEEGEPIHTAVCASPPTLEAERKGCVSLVVRHRWL